MTSLKCTLFCTNQRTKKICLLCYMQAFSQKGVQASWDAPRTKNGRLWTPKFWGKSEIIFNYFPKYINISEPK
jgi:hypothetical protein